mmetsp:Transcript_17257/g.46826  ORF Transcript_17257/g.46826 Transcript_17257/m.46826 type:complete len:202 (-) Transcript_17257:1152-1757(-)
MLERRSASDRLSASAAEWGLPHSSHQASVLGGVEPSLPLVSSRSPLERWRKDVNSMSSKALDRSGGSLLWPNRHDRDRELPGPAACPRGLGIRGLACKEMPLMLSSGGSPCGCALNEGTEDTARLGLPSTRCEPACGAEGARAGTCLSPACSRGRALMAARLGQPARAGGGGPSLGPGSASRRARKSSCEKAAPRRVASSR